MWRAPWAAALRAVEGFPPEAAGACPAGPGRRCAPRRAARASSVAPSHLDVNGIEGSRPPEQGHRLLGLAGGRGRDGGVVEPLRVRRVGGDGSAELTAGRFHLGGGEGGEPMQVVKPRLAPRKRRLAAAHRAMERLAGRDRARQEPQDTGPHPQLRPKQRSGKRHAGQLDLEAGHEIGEQQATAGAGSATSEARKQERKRSRFPHSSHAPGRAVRRRLLRSMRGVFRAGAARAIASGHSSATRGPRSGAA